jgi:hypothetical protein
MDGLPGTAARPTALFVLGMARSGTAALTRVLSLSGAALPPAMVGASKSNPLGYWEPRKAIALNLSILRRHDSTFFDPTLRLQQEDAFGTEEQAACIAKIRAFFNKLPAAPVVVIKEPSISALAGVWFEAARLAGFDVMAIVAARHPHEVAASMGKMGAKASPELSSALWLKYTLLSERYTRGVPRLCVDYANLLDDWRRELRRISTALAIPLNHTNEDAIDEFLTQDLRHQRHSGRVTELFGTDWMSVVYEALRAAARDEALDVCALDRVFREYQTSEQCFRTVFEDHHRFRKGRFVPPSLTKLALEIAALTHGRKGTWA